MSPSPPRAVRSVLVLGAGGWGTALAMILQQAGHDVRLWGHDAVHARQLSLHRENTRYLPGVRLPAGIRVGSDTEIAALATGAEVILSVIPTQVLRPALLSLRQHLPRQALHVSCSKGFERETLELPSRLMAGILASERTVILSGPSHAEEVARGLPAALVVAATNSHWAQEAQALLNGPGFRLYTSSDPVGVEVAGAVKNVIAIAAGISDGLGFGDNTRAALLTRGLSEMTRLGVRLGARRETFAGLAGMGDLVATCTSVHSRNHAVGLRIAAGETLAAILGSMSKVAEGVETARALPDFTRRLGVEMPITEEVSGVLFRSKPPRQAVEALMSRESRDEAE